MSFLNFATKSSILITGGTSGIGCALAKFFISQGHEVLVVGKDQAKLNECKVCCDKIIPLHFDLSDEQGRKDLKEIVLTAYPQVNVLINNAAIDPTPSSIKDTTEADWSLYKEEFQINLMAAMHLSTLFLPHFRQKPNAMIINVTSIFAFVPLANHPNYSCTKAALHSFTLSLRHQLKDTNVRVVEIIPPLVDSPLLPAEFKDKAIPIDTFITSVTNQLLEDVVEISYKSDHIIRASRDELDQLFCEWNGGAGEKIKMSHTYPQSSQSSQQRGSEEHKEQIERKLPKSVQKPAIPQEKGVEGEKIPPKAQEYLGGEDNR